MERAGEGPEEGGEHYWVEGDIDRRYTQPRSRAVEPSAGFLDVRQCDLGGGCPAYDAQGCEIPGGVVDGVLGEGCIGEVDNRPQPRRCSRDPGPPLTHLGEGQRVWWAARRRICACRPRGTSDAEPRNAEVEDELEYLDGEARFVHCRASCCTVPSYRQTLAQARWRSVCLSASPLMVLLSRLLRVQRRSSLDVRENRARAPN